MDFDEVLIRVQGALITLNRTKGLQKDPKTEKEGDNKHLGLYNALRNIITTYKSNDQELRRIHFFLLLNSDFKFNDEIAEDENFSHIVFTAPTIDKFILVETIILLDLLEYACEIIVYGHMTLSLEYLKVFLNVLQRKRIVEFVSVAESVICAVHQKLLLLNHEKNHDGICSLDYAKKQMSYYFKNLLTVFSPPHDNYKMGYVIKSLFSLMCSCVERRQNVPKNAKEPPCIYSMSLPSVKEDSPNTENLDISKMEDITCLLSLFQTNLNLVDLTTWMYWSECDWKSNDSTETPKTLQMVVGEQAYICKQQLELISTDIPEVATISSVLSNMAIKPFSEDDEIEKTKDINTVLSRIKELNKPLESKKKWLIALLNFPGLLKEESCLECIKEFGVHLNTSEAILLFLERAAELLESSSLSRKSTLKDSSNSTTESNIVDDSYNEKIRKFLLEVLTQVSIEDQGKLIGTVYEKFGLTDMFLTNDFEKTATEIFNKSVNSEDRKDELFSELCALCLQCPRETVRRLLTLAIGCNSQVSFVVEVLSIMSSICCLNLEKDSLIQKKGKQKPDQKITLLYDEFNILLKEKHWNETEKSNFVLLVVQAYKFLISHQNNFLHDCLYPSMADSLETSSWNTIDLCLETINEIVSSSCITLDNSDNAALLIAILMQVLEKGRHDMRVKFSVSAASTCELIISCLPLLLEKFMSKKSAKDKDIMWLKSKVMSASPYSQYYFRKLFSDVNDEDKICKNYNSLLMLLIFQNCNFDEEKMFHLFKRETKILKYHLFKLLPSCTTSEWINIIHVFKEMISHSHEDHENLFWNLFMIISDVILVLTTVASKQILLQNKDVLYIIELWIKNFARIIKEEFWPCHKFFCPEKLCGVFHTIVNLLESVPKEENIRETCSFLLINILSEIILSLSSQQSKKLFSDADVIKLTTCISLISEEETKKGLARKLLETMETNVEE